MAITAAGPSVYGTMIPLAMGIRYACEEETRAEHPEDLHSKAWRSSVNLGSAAVAGIFQSPLVYVWDKRKAEQGKFSSMSLKTARDIVIKEGPGCMRNLREMYFGAGCVRGIAGGVGLVLADQAYQAFKNRYQKD